MFEKNKSRKHETTRSQPVDDNFSSPATPKTPSNSGRPAVIGPGIHISGDISGDENLLVEGRVEGKINLDAHQVEVGQGGRVNADIRAKVVKIAGEVRGDLVGMEKVIISSSGNVHGNIVTPRMVLEDGAMFKGGIDMDPQEQVKPAVSKPANRKPVEKKVEKPEVKSKAATIDKAKENGTYSLHGS